MAEETKTTAEAAPAAETKTATTTTESAGTTETKAADVSTASVPDATGNAADDGADDDTDTDADDEGVLSLTPQELSEIKSNSSLRKLYKSLHKAATDKFEAIAQDRAIIQSIREDPQLAARTLAKIAGLDISEPTKKAGPESEAADAITQGLADVIGPEAAQALRPVLDGLVNQQVQNALAPVNQKTESLRLHALAVRSDAEVEAFKSKHKGDFDAAIEKKMVELTRLLPAGENVEPSQYLELIYQLATSGKTKSEAVKAVTARMTKAAETAEPTTGPGAKAVKPALDLRGKTLDEAMDLAVSFARAQMNQ